jgi:hypothetical protein
VRAPAPEVGLEEVRTLTLTRKDVAATALTALAVAVFAATHEGWNVWLIGGSHRWAAGAILLLGAFTCGLGSPARRGAMPFFATLGTLALALAVLAFVTGSLTPLSLLVADIVILWAASTIRHARHEPGKPVAL